MLKAIIVFALGAAIVGAAEAIIGNGAGAITMLLMLFACLTYC